MNKKSIVFYTLVRVCHLEASDAVDVELIAGQSARLVEAERVDASSERDSKRLRAVDTYKSKRTHAAEVIRQLYCIVNARQLFGVIELFLIRYVRMNRTAQRRAAKMRLKCTRKVRREAAAVLKYS